MPLLQDLRKIGKKRLAQDPDGVHFALAVDGSQSSIAATMELTERILPQSNHTMSVFHFFDPAKTYLPPALLPDYIRSFTEKQCAALSPDQVKYFWQKRAPGRSTKEEVVYFANTHVPPLDFLVVGFGGRKIDSSADPHSRSVLGSSADFSVRKANCSVLLIKPFERDVFESAATHRTFLIGIDGALTCLRAVYDVVQLVKNKQLDKIILLHIAPDQQAALPIEYRYESVRVRMDDLKTLLAVVGIKNVSILFERANPSKTIAEQVVHISDEVNADFICVGADGVSAPTQQNYGKSFLVGSTSDAIIKMTKRHVLVSHYMPSC